MISGMRPPARTSSNSTSLLTCELGDHLAVFQRLAFVGTQLDHVAHVHLAHVELDRQRAGVFHGVVEDRGDLAAQADAAEALVRHEGNVFAGEPQHASWWPTCARSRCRPRRPHRPPDCRVARRSSMNLTGPRLPSSSGVMPVARVLEHGQRVQRNVGAAPGVGRGRQVVGVGLAGHLEDGELDALGHFGAAGEPLGIGPALQHGFGVGIALVGLFLARRGTGRTSAGFSSVPSAATLPTAASSSRSIRGVML